jgi:PIN domain nuclease of toxin-antitoxin system
MSALLLVDTHVLYRWRVEPEKLTRPQLRALRNAERRSAIVSVSSITLWELALLAERGRIERKIPLDAWLAELVSQPLIEVLPITPEIAATGAQLGSKFHNDPGDRIIVATARCHRLKLLTSDERIRDWGGVSVI